MTAILTAGDFHPHVGKRFTPRGHDMALTLVSVQAVATTVPAGMARTPFTLIFNGAPDNLLAEGLHTVEIEDGPVLDLYITPIVTPVRSRQDYQAAFN